MKNSYGLAIHGGAGTITRASMTSEKEARYRAVLAEALAAGEEKLKEGELAIDAVEAAVKVMEDSELFNAGRGAVFTHEGKHEMDASIMDGRARTAGAVAGVETVKNPIELARMVMDRSEHVFLMGRGAEEFASLHQLKIMQPSYFSTSFRKEQLLSIRDTGRTQLDHSDEGSKKYGTVGAVALDTMGNLAAATSTGGITNKQYGRVGDTPILGAGTYAENGVGAISATGWGEFFIRAVAAYDIAARVKYGGLNLEEACTKTIFEHIADMGGDGGVIAIDAEGRISMPFNTEGMYRGRVQSESEAVIEIYKAT